MSGLAMPLFLSTSFPSTAFPRPPRRAGPCLPLAAVPASRHWSALRAARCAVVDKSLAAARLLTAAPLCVVHRPPGFGKSTLLSLAEALLAGRRELFRGLAVDSNNNAMDVSMGADVSNNNSSSSAGDVQWPWHERVVLRFDFAALGRADDPFVAATQHSSGGSDAAAAIGSGAVLGLGVGYSAQNSLNQQQQQRQQHGESAVFCAAAAAEPASVAAGVAAAREWASQSGCESATGRAEAASRAAAAFALLDGQLAHYEALYGASAGAASPRDALALDSVVGGVNGAVSALWGEGLTPRRRDLAGRVTRLVAAAARFGGGRPVAVLVDNYDAPLLVPLMEQMEQEHCSGDWGDCVGGSGGAVGRGFLGSDAETEADAMLFADAVSGSDSTCHRSRARGVGAIAGAVSAGVAREHEAAAFLVASFLRGLRAAAALPLRESGPGATARAQQKHQQFALSHAVVVGVQRAGPALVPLFAASSEVTASTNASVSAGAKPSQRGFVDATFSPLSAAALGVSAADAAALADPHGATPADRAPGAPWRRLAEQLRLTPVEAAVVLMDRCGGFRYPALPDAAVLTARLAPPPRSRGQKQASVSGIPAASANAGAGAVQGTFAPLRVAPTASYPSVFAALVSGSFAPVWARAVAARAALPRLAELPLPQLRALWQRTPVAPADLVRTTAAVPASGVCAGKQGDDEPDTAASAASAAYISATVGPGLLLNDNSNISAPVHNVDAGGDSLSAATAVQLFYSGVLALTGSGLLPAAPDAVAAALATAPRGRPRSGVSYRGPRASAAQPPVDVLYLSLPNTELRSALQGPLLAATVRDLGLRARDGQATRAVAAALRAGDPEPLLRRLDWLLRDLADQVRYKPTNPS